jgi:hypothetical protein
VTALKHRCRTGNLQYGSAPDSNTGACRPARSPAPATPRDCFFGYCRSGRPLHLVGADGGGSAERGRCRVPGAVCGGRTRPLHRARESDLFFRITSSTRSSTTRTRRARPPQQGGHSPGGSTGCASDIQRSPVRSPASSNGTAQPEVVQSRETSAQPHGEPPSEPTREAGTGVVTPRAGTDTAPLARQPPDGVILVGAWRPLRLE